MASDRLSPAQKRVVDAMRDGAELVLVESPGRYVDWVWELWSPHGHDRKRVRDSTVGVLIERGVISSAREVVRSHYVLAPAYQETPDA